MTVTQYATVHSTLFKETECVIDRCLCLVFTSMKSKEIVLGTVPLTDNRLVVGFTYVQI